MLIFAIPLKSKAYSNNFDLVLENLDRTVGSILNSKSDEYHAFVITNEPELVQPRVELLDNFTVLPFFGERDEKVLNPGHHDMDRKRILLGAHLRESSLLPAWVMTLDSDDLVHNDLVGFVNDHQQRTGFIIRSGFILEAQKKILTRTFDFRAGSRCIFWTEHKDLPSNPEDFDSFYSMAVMEQDARTLRARGLKAIKIRWPAALYFKGHAESISADPQTRIDKAQQVAGWSTLKRAKRSVIKKYQRAHTKFLNHQIRSGSRKEEIMRNFGRETGFQFDHLIKPVTDWAGEEGL